MMNSTNLGYQDTDRLLQTKEELEYWAVTFSESLNEYQSAFIKHHPSVDALEKEMEEARSALVEWAIEFNNVWGKS